MEVAEERRLDKIHDEACELYEKLRYQEAEALFRQELEGRRSHTDPSSKKTLKCVYRLGCTLCTQRKYAEAEQLFRREPTGASRSEGENLDLVSLRHSFRCPLYRWEDLPATVPGSVMPVEAYMEAAKICVECRMLLAAAHTVHRGFGDAQRGKFPHLQIHDSRILQGSQPQILLRPLYRGATYVDIGIIDIRYDTCQSCPTTCPSKAFPNRNLR